MRSAIGTVFCVFLLSLSSLCNAGETVDAASAARSLLARLLPSGAGQFEFEVIGPDNGRDVFEVESRDSKTVIRGNNGVAMALGLNWFLKHHCHCHVSWYGDQLNLPQPLPRVVPKVRRVSWARHRYFLNYCCFGYSLPWWDWPQWERLIDWMALNGVNRPLSVTGQETVWQAVCRRLGMSEAQIAEFLAGPPFLPFQWMGCLDGYGEPLPQSWIARHEELEQRILARERELGMTPVLQGFTGHVPGSVAQLYPTASLQRINWIEWETHLLDPLDPLFAEMAGMFMEEQTKRFGTDHLYAADPFIEMVPPSGDEAYLAGLGRAIYNGLARTDPQAVWVLQGWAFMNQREFWTQPRFKAFLDAVPSDRMVVLDLYCESTPMWDKTDAFCGKPWLWCNVQSFGRTVGLGAALNCNNDGLFAARHDPQSGQLSGLGFVNEGLCYNPVAYDLMFESAWRGEPVDLKVWVADYAHHRYGKANVDAEHAWQTLLDTVLNTPTQSVSAITSAPALARSPGTTPYDLVRLAEAWRDLLHAADELGSAETFRFDLVNVARQVLADHGNRLHNAMVKAWRAKDASALEQASRRFLGLIHDLDELLATQREFLLGGWLEDAKRWGETPDERARCEWNARRVVTLWGETFAINDYARKQWAGMLDGYYAPRWQRLLDAARVSLRENRPLDSRSYNEELLKWTAGWAEETGSFATEPRGDSIAVARRLWAKYADEFKPEAVTPDAVSLTTGRPVTCSSALPPYPARLANDGMRSETDRYWATDVNRDPVPWWQVDLEKLTTVGRVVVVCYFADQRYYGFTVEVSNDGQHWEMVADRRDNQELSTDEGHTCSLPPRAVRYLRVTQTHNSANTGRHLVEVMAYPE
jgi:alpha-N-acetylglucosaminidase